VRCSSRGSGPLAQRISVLGPAECKKVLDTALGDGESPAIGKVKPDQILEHEDVMRLLRSEIGRAGSQLAWQKGRV
jgi:hypothetical protein